MNIWKLLIALAVDAVLFIVALRIFEPAGFGAVKWQVWVVIAVAWVGLALKLLLADLVADKFEYHKHGYDFCTLTMGATLTTLALQVLAADRDLLPLLPTYNLSQDKTIALMQTLQQRTILLAALFIASVFLSMLTARISRAVVNPATRGRHILGFFNFSLGVLAFAGYFVLLVAKSGMK